MQVVRQKSKFNQMHALSRQPSAISYKSDDEQSSFDSAVMSEFTHPNSSNKGKLTVDKRSSFQLKPLMVIPLPYSIREKDAHSDDTQHNDTQHNDTQHNGTHRNDTEHDDTEQERVDHADSYAESSYDCYSPGLSKTNSNNAQRESVLSTAHLQPEGLLKRQSMRAVQENLVLALERVRQKEKDAASFSIKNDVGGTKNATVIIYPTTLSSSLHSSLRPIFLLFFFH